MDDTVSSVIGFGNASIIGIALGSIAGLIVLIILILCIVQSCKKKTEVDYVVQNQYPNAQMNSATQLGQNNP